MSSESLPPRPPQPLPEVAFLRLQDEVLDAQGALERGLRAAASPMATAEDFDGLSPLRDRRDALLMQWARAGLAVMLNGGQVQALASPRSGVARMVAPVHSPVPAPPPALAPPPAPVVPTGPPAELAQIERLSQVGVGPTWSRAVQSDPRGVEEADLSLEAELDALREAPSWTDPRTELSRIEAAIDQVQQGIWNGIGRDAQRAMVGNIVARARHLQDEVDLTGWPTSDLQTLDRVFSTMTGFSKRERPGFVFGLMRDHRPQLASWREDAQQWWEMLEREVLPQSESPNPERVLADLTALAEQDAADEVETVAALDSALDADIDAEDPRLVRVAAKFPDVLRKHARYKKLRKAIRQAEMDDEASEAELGSASAALPQDWALWDKVRGRSAAIIGGDLRAEARDRIRDAFELESLDWHTTDHGRNVQRAANAVAGGSVELVIILRRFIGHDVDRIIIPACRDAGVPWVSVERGYGITQIRLALERFLDAPA